MGSDLLGRLLLCINYALLITQKGSSSIMERDGRRAARERNDDLRFCFTLESSLNFREEFDDSFFPSLHTKGDIVQLLVWRVS